MYLLRKLNGKVSPHSIVAKLLLVSSPLNGCLKGPKCPNTKYPGFPALGLVITVSGRHFVFGYLDIRVEYQVVSSSVESSRVHMAQGESNFSSSYPRNNPEVLLVNAEARVWGSTRLPVASTRQQFVMFLVDVLDKYGSCRRGIAKYIAHGLYTVPVKVKDSMLSRIRSLYSCFAPCRI